MKRSVALAFGAALVVAACGGGGGGASATTINVEERDFDLTALRPSAKAGELTLEIRNLGKIPHEVLIVRTDLDGAKLPVTAAGDTVDETNAALTIVGSARNILPGASATLTADVKAGNYILLCNISQHYKQHMWQQFKVT
ncbi:MAG: sulfocyanin-like copper-binding protein [Acidimicrobiia bacterium]